LAGRHQSGSLGQVYAGIVRKVMRGCWRGGGKWQRHETEKLQSTHGESRRYLDAED
jgi:hypothetical protein